MIAVRLRDAPPLLAQLHAEHMARQARMRAAAVVASLPAPPTPKPAKAERVKIETVANILDERIQGIYADCIARIWMMSYWWGSRKRITLKSIKMAVCARYGVNHVDLISKRRDKEAVIPRHMGMWLAKKLTPCSFPEIARAFGRFDHTTALSAVSRMEQRIRANESLRTDARVLKAQLLGPSPWL